MDFSMYDKILIRSVIGIFIVCIVLCIISIMGIIYVIHNLDKISVIICVILLSGVIVGIIVFSAITIPQYVYDIKNNAYITYSGEYNIVSNGRSDILIYIENNSIRLESNAGFDEGEYAGTIVYSERSKRAFDIQGIEKNDGSNVSHSVR